MTTEHRKRPRYAMGMIPLSEARAFVLDRCVPLPIVQVPIDDAAGLVTSEAVEAIGPIPPFDNTAMDGFAVRSSDVAQTPVELRVVDNDLEGTARQVVDSRMGPLSQVGQVRFLVAEQRGIAHARNTALGLGDADFYVFIDDDEVVEGFEGLFAVIFIGVGDNGVFAIDEHGVDAIFFRAAEVEGGDLGHGVAEVEVGLLVELLELFLELR